MSSEKTPILSGAIPAFEMLMTKWEQLAENPLLKPMVQEGLNLTYKYYNQMDHTRAYVVAMCKYIISSSCDRADSCSPEPCDTPELD